MTKPHSLALTVGFLAGLALLSYTLQENFRILFFPLSFFTGGHSIPQRSVTKFRDCIFQRGVRHIVDSTFFNKKKAFA